MMDGTPEENPEMTLAAFANLLQAPFFIIDVKGPKTFIFRSINDCFAAQGGGDLSTSFGKEISEAFPTRLAETLIENYEICRSTGESFRYEENLQFNGEPRWWATTLTPVKDNQGCVTQILGLAQDISHHKRIELDAVARLGKISNLNNDLKVFASIAAKDTRGPLETILALLNIVNDGFLDLGDQKSAQLKMAISKTEETIVRIGDIISAAGQMGGDDVSIQEFNFGHLCRDYFAQVDPEGELEIEYPDIVIASDNAVTQIVLRQLIENAAHYCETLIRIDTDPNQSKPGFLKFRITDDGASEWPNCRADRLKILPATEKEENLAGLFACQNLIKSLGGDVSQSVDKDAGTVTISFGLPTTTEDPSVTPSLEDVVT